jgi:hypothetical protein
MRRAAPRARIVEEEGRAGMGGERNWKIDSPPKIDAPSLNDNPL